VAAQAGLKWQLVHYYFRTMDDLFVAMLHRRGEEALRVQAEALAGPRPLRALWEFSTRPEVVALAMEFMALARHRKTIQAEIARYAQLFRAAEIEAMSRLAERYQIPAEQLPPPVMAVMMSSLSRVVVIEQALGMEGGHRETLEFVERHLQKLEGDVT
jgi:AcrR family transcriptional regulator